jgi:hypothetical protein
MTVIEMLGAVGAMLSGGAARDEGDDVSTRVAADGVGDGNADAIILDGRAWPRDGAKRAEFMRELSNQLHVEGKAAWQEAERRAAEAKVRWLERNRIASEHADKIKMMLRDQLRLDARAAIAGAWATYRDSGSGEALLDIGGALRVMRRREVKELGEQTYIVVEVLLSSVRPGVVTYTDGVANAASQCLQAAVADARPALRGSLELLDRLMVACGPSAA